LPTAYQRRNAKAQAEGYASYGQKRHWQELHAKGVCLGCRISMPPVTDEQRVRSKLCDICNDVADPRDRPRRYGWQRRYERLQALHRRLRGLQPGWGDGQGIRSQGWTVA